ncbi:MAG: acylphosphatase [ANME-2 cluster archaeon]|jgi:acylphosphatase|nr:acylphosphatase [ANME-2 cluster archaeon]
MTVTRVHLLITGRVQGVYFRHHTMEKAVELELKGWVRNRMDGKVEAVFEGDPAKVIEMIHWCQTGPTHANVTDVQEAWEEPVEENGPFRIKYD